MKTKQTLLFALGLGFILPGILLTPVASADEASDYCEQQFPAKKGDTDGLAKQSACKTGYSGGDCTGITPGKSALSKKDLLDICNDAGRQSGVTTATGSTSECGTAKTAIISCDAKNSGSLSDNGVWTLLIIVINIMTAGVGVLAVGGLVYGAFLYTTAEDKADQIKQATTIITNVFIGLVAFALMWAGLNFIIPGGVFS